MARVLCDRRRDHPAAAKTRTAAGLELQMEIWEREASLEGLMREAARVAKSRHVSLDLFKWVPLIDTVVAVLSCNGLVLSCHLPRVLPWGRRVSISASRVFVRPFACSVLFATLARTSLSLPPCVYR
jgi:hypothetical protein